MMSGLYVLAGILILPLIVSSYYVHMKMRQVFVRYSEKDTKKGINGKRVARSMLNAGKFNNIIIEEKKGVLSDHYDPKQKVICLSTEVARSHSISAVGIAAHEAAHALQDSTDYVLFKLRNRIFPLVDMAGFLILPLVLLSFFLWRTRVSGLLIDIAILLFLAVLGFYLITLPVEFNASRRALSYLKLNGVVDKEELKGVETVLRAAALTYIIGSAVAPVQLVRLWRFKR